MDSAKPNFENEKRYLVGIIADEITTLGFLLAGVGEKAQGRIPNYLIVYEDDPVDHVESFFHKLCTSPNIGIILIGSDIWEYMEPYYLTYPKKQLPIIMDILTKTSLTKPLKLRHSDLPAHKDVKKF